MHIAPEVREAVLSVYREKGLAATKKEFPDISVPHVISRYCTFRYVIPYTDHEKIELARMAGFISFADQAAFLMRPQYFLDSMMIWSYWRRAARTGSQMLHGLTGLCIRKLCYRDVPIMYLPIQHIPTKNPRPFKNRYGRRMQRKMVIWVDAENYLRSSVPDNIREVIRDCARFQRWLYQTEDAKSAINKIISERTGLASRASGAVRFREVLTHKS